MRAVSYTHLPTIVRPVEQEFDDDVPTQSAWEDVDDESGDENDRWLTKYCRTIRKNGYEILQLKDNVIVL